MGKVASLVVFNGFSKDRKGRNHKVAEQIGSLNINEKGTEYILLKKSVNLAGFSEDGHAGTGNVLVHIFRTKDCLPKTEGEGEPCLPQNQ